MFSSNQAQKVIYNTWRGKWPTQRIPLPVEIGLERQLTVGFMGRVEAEKGIDVLCAAWAELKKHGIKLLIAGSGRAAYIQHLQDQYDVPAACFLGTQAPETFFPTVDLVVVPSRAFEGLGNVAFEAMVFGRPVIVSDQGGLPEIPDEHCGSVTAAGDVRALIAAILGYAESQSMLLMKSEAASRRAAVFHPDRQADSYESFLADLVQQSK
jgi:glycosyltransferase involved in cell wall biosynthesis